ncbi:hypothetical protein ACP70R_014461 [Stipagrostis hirtigluma subsp. patula]
MCAWLYALAAKNHSEKEMSTMWPPPFLYPPLASGLAAATMSVVAFLALVGLGVSELRGDNMAYSKFWRRRGDDGGALLLPSRAAMVVAYGPALAAAVASFAVPGAVEGLRAQILSAVLAVHFLKRVLEVFFVHRYSGCMPLTTALLICSCYLFNTVAMIYVQHLSRGLPEPPVDLLYPGVVVFAVGLAGNFYHHCLLARLRGDGGGDKGYKIPKGGLFELVTCPHYLFEIVGFFGFAMIAQTVYALAVASGTAAYLVGRSCATRRWYESKFEEFPTRVKALVPYVL